MNYQSKETIFEINNICKWNLETHKTVYPPREDTYLLANAILKLKKHEGLAMEIGCGSGAISMLLATLGWKVIAYDVNPYAVACARGNVRKYNLENSVIIEEGGIGENIDISEKIDIIIWNLPYLDPTIQGEKKLEYIEDAAYLDLENDGWNRRLIDTLETYKMSDGCVVMLLFRTVPESNSSPFLWKERGWSGRKITEEIIGDEKIEVHAFWKPGRNISPVIIEKCRSTMDEIKKNNSNNWTRIMAKKQTKGRGRRNTVWKSDVEDMVATWKISKNILEEISPGILQITAGASIANMLKIGLKWPNDLFSNDFRKMGGIIIESDSENDSLRIGVGINKKKKINEELFTSSGWEETLGELKNIDIYNMVDIALSSNFENHHILPSVYRQEMIDLSWKSLSKIFSRGVLIEYEKYNYRAIGLSEEGTIELLNRSKLVSVDDLEKIEWKFDMC
jgi:methylase of polypeptide subunit release factors/biotin-(acetyl-CoA carboxylase) ligase